ncbi:MAG: aldehyde dehydrogenase family protein [Myxococcales bacterium]|nr:aldehyde dehydrogenase family protein [Myxococcales bacterium]
MPKPEDIKITYTTKADPAVLDAFHAAYDNALEAIRAEFGREYPMMIGGEEVRSESTPIVDVSPIDTTVTIGTFQAATPAHVAQAVGAARAAKRAWASTPWQERCAILRRAAVLIRQHKFELAALMSLEVGKSRMEAMGDAEESADLIDYYCQQMADHGGFIKAMNKITPIETNTSVLRPYGVFACIAPFNFPLALSCGMSSAALIAGNTLVYKPAEDACLTGWKLYQIYMQAGVPAGVFNFLTGVGEDMGDALWKHPDVDGVVFTGSKNVGMRIFKGFSTRWVKPVLMELGGKNPAVVMDTADLDAAAEGVARSAWGLQNQKCSACSRVYVHKDVADAFLDKLIARTRALNVGDPSERDVNFGPVINAQSVRKYESAVARARAEGEVLIGGEGLRGGVFDKGHYVAPTVARVPLTSSLFTEEFFAPFLAVGVVESLDEALREANKVEYGLTAGVFTGSAEELERFFNEIEAGVVYANKRTGATTGAWPGAQPFCGWKGSGGSGKGGCGPYYVAQFMREQTRTVIVEG